MQIESLQLFHSPQSKEIVDKDTSLQLFLRLPNALIETCQCVEQIQSIRRLRREMIPVGLNVVQIYISEIIQQTVQAAVCVLKLDSCVTIYLECLLPAELVISLPSLLKDIDQDG